MKLLSIIVLFVFTLLLFDCSSMRNRRKKSRTTSQASSRTGSRRSRTPPAPQAEEQIPQKGLFSDTTTILVKPGFGTKYQFQGDEFSEALRLFDIEKFSDACRKFAELESTYNYGDSLYYETKFFISECKILNNDIQDAEYILKNLLNDNLLPPSIFQKVLVRLGQVNCIQNKPKQAKKYFDLLKAEFPNSVYNELANCGSLKQ